MKYAAFNQEGNIVGFYSPDIHSVIPSNAIEITEEQWQDCLSNQGCYKVIELKLTFLPNKPDPEILKQHNNEIIKQQIKDLEAKGHRALREAVLDQAESIERIRDIENQISELRSRLL